MPTSCPTRPPTRSRPSLRRRRLGLLLLAVLPLLGTACNLRSVGANYSGQLGDGTTANRTTVIATGTTTFTTVSAGADHTCGIAEGGALYCWGDGRSSRLGLGDTAVRTEPTRVGTHSDWTAVSAGSGHTCGARTGVVQCWGANGSGQAAPELDAVPVPEPTTVYTRPGDPVTSVSAGADHSCSVHASGTLLCWGRNDDGRLGTGDTRDSNRVEIVGVDYRSVSVSRHTCAVTTSRELHCWGPNEKGQLGTGDLETQDVPTAVFRQPGWAAADVGSRHTCARAVDGSAWCWGDGGGGRLGTGSAHDRIVPIAVAPSARWIDLSAGQSHTCGIRADHRVLCWGTNGNRQAGEGTTADRLVPTPMAGDLEAIAVTAGGQHTHVLLAPDE